MLTIFININNNQICKMKSSCILLCGVEESHPQFDMIYYTVYKDNRQRAADLLLRLVYYF